MPQDLAGGEPDPQQTRAHALTSSSAHRGGGEFGQRLRAYVVRTEGSDPSEDTLRDHVKAHLERYKVPRDTVFVDAIPRNPTGKILRRELPGG